MVDLYNQKARELWADPLLVELVRLLLLDAVVAGDVKALAVVGLQVRIGRLSAEIAHAIGKVIVKNHQRKMRIGMVVEAFRHQHNRRQIHGPSPELRQQLALDFQVPDILRIFRLRDWRDFLIECD